MIHVTRSRLAEIVLFGRDQQLLTPLAVNAGNEIMVTSSGGDEISVSKFSVQDGDQKRIVSTRVDDVIRADRRIGRHLSRRGPGPAGGQDRRRAGLPVRGRCLARGRPDLRSRRRRRAGRRAERRRRRKGRRPKPLRPVRRPIYSPQRGMHQHSDGDIARRNRRKPPTTTIPTRKPTPRRASLLEC